MPTSRRCALRCVALASAALIGWPTTGRAAPLYHLVNLQDVISGTIGLGPGGSPHTTFTPTGINDAGTIVGTIGLGPLDRSKVALISPDLGSVTTYGAGNTGSGKAIQLEGYKVNNSNEFAGDAYYFLDMFHQSPVTALAYVGSTPYLLNYAPGTDNRAVSINDFHTVLGQAEAVVYKSVPPYALSNATVLNELNPLGNYRVSDINNSGVIVGSFANPAHPNDRGFVDDHGSFTTIQFPGSLGTYVNGISNSGIVVGTWYNNNHDYYGFIYNHGAYTDIPLPNNPDVFLEGINDAGQIVGDYFFRNYDQLDGFLLNPVPDISLETVGFRGDIPPPTIQPSGGPIPRSFRNQYALEEFRFFMVPEPSSAALFAGAIVGAGWLRRRSKGRSPV